MQAPHPGKLAHVGCDQNRPERIGMGRDQEIVGTDRFASGFKFDPYLTILSIGRHVEGQDLDAAENCFDIFEQLG